MLQECIEEGHALDFLIMDLILNRVRYNGNQQDLELGECFVGMDEIGSIIGKDDKFVKRALERLSKKGVLNAAPVPRKGTKIKVLYASAYNGDRRTNAAPTPHGWGSNLDKTRQEIYMSSVVPTSEYTLEHTQIKDIYPQRSGPTPWNKGFEKLKKYIKDLTPFIKACSNYAEHCKANDLVGTKFVKSFDTFCTKGNWEDWVDYVEDNPSAPKDGMY